MPLDIDVRVCGLSDCSFLPIDIEIDDVDDPRHIVYSSIQRMFDKLDRYDFFLNIEDDILIAQDMLARSMTFNACSRVSEVYLPNRMERDADGVLGCVDLRVIPGWNPALHRQFRETTLGVACNPHSALAFLSREQMHFAADRVDLSSRQVIVGGLMASAYANLHAPFLLWRAKSDLNAHHVIHLDDWDPSSFT